MIHVVVTKCLIGLPSFIHIEIFKEVGVGVGVLKIEESESEVLYTNSTVLLLSPHPLSVPPNGQNPQNTSTRPTHCPPIKSLQHQPETKSIIM
jgi:hypothetical protein